MFQLKNYIKEIARVGSFSQAADNLYVSQPSISACVKRLEQRIGEPLFERSANPIKLTPCGEAYLKAAQKIDLAEEEFNSFLMKYKNLSTGKLVLGGSNLNISYVLPSLLQRFVSKYPNIEIELVEGSINTLQQMLLAGQIDLVMDSCDMDEGRFKTHLYKGENLILAASLEHSKGLEKYALTYEDICNNRHREESALAVPLNKLCDIPFIAMTPETDTAKRVEAICKAANFAPKTILSFSQQSTAFNMASAGLGITFISDTLIKNAHFIPNLRFFKVGDSEAYRHIKVFRKASRPLSYATEVFLNMLEE